MSIEFLDEQKPIDFEAIRAKLAAGQSPRYWRSLDELAETEEFTEFLHREFPAQASVWPEDVSRRNFLKLMGASLSLGGLAACSRQPDEKIVPYVKAPEDVIPGTALPYATAYSSSGYAMGALVTSFMGRPTKVEGHPTHPASLGATDLFAQASILTMYDPDRSSTILNSGRESIWDSFYGALSGRVDAARLKQGAGLSILTETVTSPALANQIKALLTALPKAKWHQYQPASRDSAKTGAVMAYGEATDTQYHLDRANVIVSLDADFLSSGPGAVRYTHDFSSKRLANADHPEMSRLYAVESTPNNTGAMADHRLGVRPGQIEHFARAIAGKMGIALAAGTLEPAHEKWVDAVVRDLKKDPKSSVVIPGDNQPAVVHALAHAINQALGNTGTTVTYTAPVEANPVDQLASIKELAGDMEAGRVDTLIILGGNPVYTAPADLKLESAMDKVAFRTHLSLYDDETSRLCHWHIPETHYLEQWGDLRAFDGTISVVQPLIAPLYFGKSSLEMVAAINGQPNAAMYDLVRDYWKSQSTAPDFEHYWKTTLSDGFLAESKFPDKLVKLTADFSKQPAVANPPSPAGTGLDVVFRLDPTIGDGFYANNAWLQELPKPLTKLVWDNAALISPRTAQKLGAATNDVVELAYKGRIVKAAVWVMPVQPEGVVTLYLGYGRSRTGKVGKGTGFNAYALQTSDAPWFGSDLAITKTGATYKLATTQTIANMNDGLTTRPIIREATLEEFKEHPDFAQEMAETPEKDVTLFPQGLKDNNYDGNAWGMAIDLNVCTGCSACTIACQAENNIAVVGKEQVIRRRVMHWIRVDRYYKGDPENPEGTVHQPVPCMHCENAPCEVVCPVAATNHSKEGLNDMVYNRCIGTRYCSNNCPYKVRRYNFLEWDEFEGESTKLQKNPNVTVRTRGVMEKCTYCVQRINKARIDAKKEDRPIRDGEIVTACQAVCPASAIVFGNLADPESRVSKLKTNPRNYALLGELNTRPRTTYLAKVTNPNPELESGKA
ncbi:MAG: TAT-variant-translocated molybdopterin oxidoreductase [Candidatus Hydrogenedentes bacterium]|nr:TAT-variant-translocated molybdopterin oxidoreductase [Candidatus Hydrogenedentota bacterium]